MSGQLIWQFVSYALVLSVGAISFEMENYWLAGLVLIGFPAFRIHRRFAPSGGYRMAADQAYMHGPIEVSGGLVNRSNHPTLFKFCLICEVAIVVGILTLSMVPRDWLPAG